MKEVRATILARARGLVSTGLLLEAAPEEVKAWYTAGPASRGRMTFFIIRFVKRFLFWVKTETWG